MKLTNARVNNFRCIEDSEEFSLETVTCFVGKNEAGKSALLEALWRINPHKQAGYEVDRDYPRRFLTDYDERHSGQPAKVTITHWRLDDEDREVLESIIGPATATIADIIITSSYPSKAATGLIWEFVLDEKALNKWLVEQSTLNDQEKELLKDCENFKSLKTVIASQSSERWVEFKKRLEGNPHYKAESIKKSISDLLQTRLPKFVYFSNYDTMKGKVPLQSLNQRKANPQSLDSHEQLFIDFCEYAGTTLDELVKINQFERLRARFESAQSKITRQIFRYWSSNRHLRVVFSRDTALSGDPPPYNEGQIFNIRIWNELHETSVPFDDRSVGFVWFFSFLVFFSQVKKRLGNNLILLLDEPGLNLHAKAQGDLLRFIGEVLAPNHQVLYSTHSLFMIPSENLLSVRIVEDVIKEPPDAPPQVFGTKVRTDVLGVNRDTLFPLQGALGFEISQTLFIGKHTLIVEGPSDLIYLKAFSRQLAQRNRVSLDARWTICPVGGIDKVPAFLALFNANDLRMAVLVDLASGVRRKVDETRKLVERLRTTGRVFTYADVLAVGEADVEDMLGAAGYVELVNTTYSLVPGIKLPETSSAPGRIVKWVDEQMRLQPQVPEFDHYAPAEFLLQNRQSFLDSMTGCADAMDRFESLFRALNAAL